MMIRKLGHKDFTCILKIINNAARAYKGIIPDDRYKEPYMPQGKLQEQIDRGVKFFGWEERGRLAGVMGIQYVKDVALIRHAYVPTNYQRRGTGTRLLRYLISMARTSCILVGTWKRAGWAIKFYEKHGFELTSNKEKDILLREYWSIPQRQIEESVVLRLRKTPPS